MKTKEEYRKEFARWLGDMVNEGLPGCYMCVPHRSPPFVVDAELDPPVEEDGDRFVAGDHDMYLVMPVGEAFHSDSRHQSNARLAEAFAYTEDWLGHQFVNTKVADYCQDLEWLSDKCQAIVKWGMIDWTGCWPEVYTHEGSLIMSAYLRDGGEEDSVNFQDEFMYSYSRSELTMLRAEAESHGDSKMVALCDDALAGDEDAIQICVETIVEARMKAEVE